MTQYSAALDMPVKAVVFRPLSLWRRIKNNLATTLFFTSFAHRVGAAGLAAGRW